MKEIMVGNKKVGEGHPIFFVAEIGINHNGDLKIAKKLIDLAAIAGCDAVKFQKRTPEICVPDHKKDVPRETPWGVMSYLDYKKTIELDKSDHIEIDDYCKKKDIIWFASPWDIPSFEFLEEFDVPCYKIASAMLTNKNLLERIKATGKPVFLSTGMSTLLEIHKAVTLLNGSPLVIMHCNSSYPSDDAELNLRVIQNLKKRYPEHVIGYSGHERGYTASLVAAFLGAKVIERHITLDRAMWGSDHAASLEYPALRRLVRDLRLFPQWMGDGIKRVYESELLIKDKLRNIDNL